MCHTNTITLLIASQNNFFEDFVSPSNTVYCASKNVVDAIDAIDCSQCFCASFEFFQTGFLGGPGGRSLYCLNCRAPRGAILAAGFKQMVSHSLNQFLRKLYTF